MFVLHHMQFKYLAFYKLYNLLESHVLNKSIQYDIVISLRIDCIFINNFVFNKFNDNTIYIPINSDYGGINDQIAYGKIDVMKNIILFFQIYYFF